MAVTKNPAVSKKSVDDRRRSPRATISFPVECRLLPERDYFYTVSKDLSESGARIMSEKFIPKDNLIKVNINLIGSVVDVKARVVWCNKQRVSERYSAGLEFLEVDHPKLESIKDLIQKVFSA